jgi:hypothetical protein
MLWWFATVLLLLGRSTSSQESLTVEQAAERAVGWFNNAEALISSSSSSSASLSSDVDDSEGVRLRGEALQLMAAVVNADPNYALGAFFLGMMRQRTGDHEGAAWAYRKCCALEDKNVDCANNLGKALSDLNQGG